MGEQNKRTRLRLSPGAKMQVAVFEFWSSKHKLNFVGFQVIMEMEI